jgi:crotonobetainyl-CoA:carnitine CoA-transferase CaiB-like acyl-CoA transferase
MTTLAIPVEFDGTPASIRAPAPKLGEHTEVVLREVGLVDTEIAAVGSAQNV